MKVLLVSHTCQSRTEGQPRPQAIGEISGVDLMLLTPALWKHYGQWRHAQTPRNPSYRYAIARTRWPWVGPAQNYLHWYPQMAGVIRRFQPDIIDLWEEPWSLVAAQACWLRDRLAPRARIVTETEQNILKDLPPPFEQLRSYVLKNIDFLVCRNREAIEVARHKGYTGRCEVVPNSVDAGMFRPLDRRRCREEMLLSGFTVGYIGRIVEDKGLEDLAQALALCPPDIKGLFVGSGEYLPALQERVRSLGLENRVRFLPGQPMPQLPPIMNAIDVLALPSRTTPSWKEQFGRVIIEAHACGTPVIGSDSGAIPDVVESGGLTVPERDPAALAATIQHLSHDPELCRALGEKGHEQVHSRYTWARVAQQMHGIYKSVL
jgi:glycosyltransferase involved in cell wall biosynthesis